MRKGKVRNGLLPNSLKIISSCLKTVSANASTVVRSAGASVAASIAVPAEDEKEQVLWVGFDKLELGPSNLRCILLLGYANGFQVVDVEDGSNVCELVSKRDGPVTFLQMQPTPEKSESYEGFRASHPLLLVVAGDETNGAPLVQGTHLNGFIRDSVIDQQTGSSGPVPTVVRFYSLKSDSYVHVLRFRSAVYLIRCSPRIIAVALASQIYCFDAVTLENKFSVLTCPMPLGGQGLGVNIGYGPMAVGPRWLAYASNNPLMPNTGRLSPQSLTPSPGVSPSTSPGNGSLMARYAVESSKQLAAGLINLGDMGYKTLSKYCQELLPETSNSPLSSNFSRKAGRVTSAIPSNETDIAGMVVVKDFVSKAIISQFRAHTSPISALCFDPSGTLLVTASVHGNNINVFRIMPSRTRNVSGSVRYDWNSSHVHLYKLHRGIRTAVIQDICFSQYSQWVAIVSSRGTCHIFVLSPFGGDVSIQAQNLHTEGSFLSSTLSLPWWTSTSCVINSQSPPPPPPIMLSDVSRIRNGCTGWLDTVTNAAAASATGKTSVPSGALAATFHNSFYQNLHPVRSKINLLEHLLVYAPSGHVVQHELLPSVGLESCNSSSRAAPGTVQDEELRVNAEPVQCWAVCRRSNWPEREGSLLTIASDGSETEEVVMDTSDCEDNEMKYAMPFNNTLAGKDLVKNHEKPHWYLSNAEVQLSSGRIPIWQKSKIFFYQMIPSMDNERIFLDDYSGGEIEIEKVAIHEVEIRRKDLLPVFEHFQCAKSNWNDRNSSGGRCLSVSSLEIDQTKDKFIEENIVSLTKSPSIRSVASTNVGSSRITDNLRLDQTTILHGSTDCSILLGHYVNKIHRQSVSQLNSSSSFLERSQIGEDGSVLKGLSGGSNLVERGITNDGMSGEGLNTYNSPASDDNTEKNGTTESHVPLDFAQYFHEGYCKMLELDDCRELPDVANDADSSSSHCEREKSEEDAHCDDMLGGVFAFSEVGIDL